MDVADPDSQEADPQRVECDWFGTPAYAPYDRLAIAWGSHCSGTRWQRPPEPGAVNRVILIGDGVLSDPGLSLQERELVVHTGLRARLVELLGPTLRVARPDPGGVGGREWYVGDEGVAGEDIGLYRACAREGAGLHTLITSVHPLIGGPDGRWNCLRAVAGESVIVLIAYGRYTPATLRDDVENVSRRPSLDPLAVPEDEVIREFTEAVRGVRAKLTEQGAARVWVYVTDFIDYSDGHDTFPEGCRRPRDIDGSIERDAAAEAEYFEEYRALIAAFNRTLVTAAVDAASVYVGEGQPDSRFDVVFANGHIARNGPDRGALSCARRGGESMPRARACGGIHALTDGVLDTCCRSALPECLLSDVDAHQVIGRASARTILNNETLAIP